MSIILKEHDWAAEMISSRSLGKKPSETLSRVARYYMDEGYSPSESRNMLEAFVKSCIPYGSYSGWDNLVELSIKRAKKHPAIDIDFVPITDTEIKSIEGLEGKQIRRLAFTLLCLSKLWVMVNPETDYWVWNKDSEIMAMANINTSKKRQSQMYRVLRDKGYIQFSKKVDNTNVRVCFATYGNTVIEVSDFRNLGYQYMKYNGESLYECENCGIITKYKTNAKGRKPKYCATCATKIAMKQRIDSAMRSKYKIKGDQKIFTVYMHESPDGKRYVGTTSTRLSARWKYGNGYSDNSKFSTDIIKYGWDDFKHYVIASSESEEYAKAVEYFLINKYSTDDIRYGYNRHIDDNAEAHLNDVVDTVTLTEVDGHGNDLLL